MTDISPTEPPRPLLPHPPQFPLPAVPKARTTGPRNDELPSYDDLEAGPSSHHPPQMLTDGSVWPQERELPRQQSATAPQPPRDMTCDAMVLALLFTMMVLFGFWAGYLFKMDVDGS